MLVVGSVSTRVEALGPPLAALLLTNCPNTGPVEVHRDSISVVSVVKRSCGILDYFDNINSV